MRAALSTIQQTLTPEAASILNRSIAEAARRGHGQTTPLHVAATLLSSPSGLLRQACAKSHPASAHPLQCRALDLCFSVALDRLPSCNSPAASSDQQQQQPPPPISNALMAALKRAQAHQRRGCPEQQQQPLLAVKVELEQLIVSILDDPGVSRVMREASFSSPAVKATIEQSLNSPSSNSSISSATAAVAHSTAAAGAVHKGNVIMNTRFHRFSSCSSSLAGEEKKHKDEVKKVIDILGRTKKRNPVLVGDSDPASVLKESMRVIESGDSAEAPARLRGVRIFSVEPQLANCEKSKLPEKINELGGAIEAQQIDDKGVVLDLGDLKWLVNDGNGGGQQILPEHGRAVVSEMGKLIAKFSNGGTGKFWIVGTAACSTYLRCQVYHPTMESDWDIQAVPITARSQQLFQRLGGNGMLSSSVESLSPTKGFPALGTTTIPLGRPSHTTSNARRTVPCPQCMDSFELELGRLVAEEYERSSSESIPATPALPKWLQMVHRNQSQGKVQEPRRISSTELKKKWLETCIQTHPNFTPTAIAATIEMPSPGAATTLSMPSPYSLIPTSRQPLQTSPTLCQPMRTSKPSIQPTVVRNLVERPASPPSSPVGTDLVLGQSTPSQTLKDRMKNFSFGCTQDQKSDTKASVPVDTDSFKRLFAGLIERVAWQREAASAVATVVKQSKSGNGKRRNSLAKSDTWLLFVGHDKVGKKKMAAALSELLCGTAPISINLVQPRSDSDDRESDFSYRGKTSLERIAESIRQNPFSVIMLEGFDEADPLVRSAIKRAMDRGRLRDSYGREVSLGSVIFILDADWLPDDVRSSQEQLLRSEKRKLEAARSGWQLELCVGEKSGKRQADWPNSNERLTKPRNELDLSLDLNLAAVGNDDDTGECSRNSSDLTFEHETDHGRLTIGLPTASFAPEMLMDSVDEAIMFKPVDFGPLRQKISESVSTKFASIMGNAKSLWVDHEALDRLLGGVWLTGDAAKFEEWAERVLVPSMYKLKSNLKSDDAAIVRLSVVKDCQPPRIAGGDWLPKTVAVTVNGNRL